jgi:hypothetical protein
MGKVPKLLRAMDVWSPKKISRIDAVGARGRLCPAEGT